MERIAQRILGGLGFVIVFLAGLVLVIGLADVAAVIGRDLLATFNGSPR